MSEPTDTTETRSDAGQQTARRSLPPEPEIAVPGFPVVAVCSIVPVLGGLAWAGITLGLSYSSEIVVTGVLGAAIVLVVSLGALLVTSPWRKRPVSMQMTMWLAGTVIRLLATPIVGFLLYSAAPLDGTALTLSVGAVHLATLLTEAAVMSRLLGRAVAPG